MSGRLDAASPASDPDEDRQAQHTDEQSSASP
jgi:hypothetical protein